MRLLLMEKRVLTATGMYAAVRPANAIGLGEELDANGKWIRVIDDWVSRRPPRK